MIVVEKEFTAMENGHQYYLKKKQVSYADFFWTYLRITRPSRRDGISVEPISQVGSESRRDDMIIGCPPFHLAILLMRMHMGFLWSISESQATLLHTASYIFPGRDLMRLLNSS